MLTTEPHLHIRRPSPTTAEFTVTTCPPLAIPVRLALLGVLLARIALILSSLLLLYSKYALSPFAAPIGPFATAPALFSDDFIWYAIWLAHTSPLGEAFTALAAAAPAWTIVAVCGGALYGALQRIHTTESLLVLRGLGIQTASTGTTVLGSLWGGPRTRFIPTEKIRDVLINEAPRGFVIQYYLVVVVDGEEDVVVVFPKLLPRRKIVEAVWRGVKGCLYESDGLKGVGEKG
ncbi:hypothetical protein GQ53DRAFT_318310 [Thozetella sp. PMI_491]|nr:hypothetical protein GQ53DRAFT_318310 [Thozetella sp. PMI_491]